MTSSAVSRLLMVLQLRGTPTSADTAALWRDLTSCRGLVQLIEGEGATLWLYRRFHDLQQPLDGAPGPALRQSAHTGLLQGLRIDGELRTVAAILRAAGLPFAPIKGPARRIAKDAYAYADARSTSDVDLLLPAGRVRAAWDMLVRHGYRPAGDGSASGTDHFHLPPLLGPADVAVELHSSTMPWLDPAEAWQRHAIEGETMSWEGDQYTISCATELLWHGLAHAFIDGAEGFRLRTFLDGAVIIGSERAIDWPRVAGRIARGEIRGAEGGAAVPPVMLHRWIATAAMLAGAAVPDEFTAAGRFPLARILRWKLMVIRSSAGRAGRQRLIEEAVRSELGMALTPTPRGASPLVRGRRRVATALARAGYGAWRAAHGNDDE